MAGRSLPSGPHPSHPDSITVEPQATDFEWIETRVIEQGGDRQAEAGRTVAEGQRRQATEAVERELSMMFRRARSISLTTAAEVHPELDSASYALLAVIDDAGRLRGMDLVERLNLDKSTVSRQLARLVELDLVERVADPSDGRARLVQLTESGRTRVHQVRARRRDQLRSRLTDWSTEDLHELSRLLGRLNEDY